MFANDGDNENSLLVEGVDLKEIEKIEKEEEKDHAMKFSDIKLLNNPLFWLVCLVYTF